MALVVEVVEVVEVVVLVPWSVWADGVVVEEDYEYGCGNMLEAKEVVEG